jgi:hypothetical protein
VRRRTIIALCTAAVAAAGCGGGTRQDANEPSGTFKVDVVSASFPSKQRLARQEQMVVEVRNADNRTIPNVAVTITSPPHGTSVKAFATYVPGSELASHSRPVWVIDRPPGPCSGSRAYSCQAGGPGGYATAYSNTWAAGRLAPGQTVRFVWALTAVSRGTYYIRYVVAAGLNGKARARVAGSPNGSHAVSAKTATNAGTNFPRACIAIRPGNGWS